MSDEKFIESLRTELDRAANNLDAVTSAKLAAARARALDASARSPYSRWWVAGGIGATAAVTAVATALFFSIPSPAPTALAAIDDVELLARGEKPDFYLDMDFYESLEGLQKTDA
jgi:hypothetical protein